MTKPSKIWIDKAKQIDRIRKSAKDIHDKIKLYAPDGKTIADFEVVELPDNMVGHIYRRAQVVKVFNADMREVSIMTMADYRELMDKYEKQTAVTPPQVDV